MKACCEVIYVCKKERIERCFVEEMVVVYIVVNRRGKINECQKGLTFQICVELDQRVEKSTTVDPKTMNQLSLSFP